MAAYMNVFSVSDFVATTSIYLPEGVTFTVRNLGTPREPWA